MRASIATHERLHNVLDTGWNAVLLSWKGGVLVSRVHGVLTSRQKAILDLIVEHYVRDASPVGSEALGRQHKLGVSSATIRNDMAELEQEGYISRPHSSSGSVPLDKAYRLYVETVAAQEIGEVPSAIRESIQSRLAEVERDIDEWTNVAARLLAGLVDNMAIATFPKAIEPRVRHVELVYLREFLAMLIVVLEQARLRRQLVWITEDLNLQETSNRISEQVVGHTWREIEERDALLSPVEEELVSTTASILREEDHSAHRDHHFNGLRNLLSQPEFSDSDQLQTVVESVEDGTLVQAVLNEAPESGVVRVVIGQESRGDLLWPLSVVIGRYGWDGEVMGAVGAVGPMRMEYQRTISSVGLMSHVMSDMFEAMQGS